MIIIGLTGATGSGKGLFGRIAAGKFGALHIDTDITAREVVLPGKPCLEDIKAYFGESVINKDGTLDRAALGEIVFSDSEKLKALNKITHHYITDEVETLIKKAKADGKEIVIIDAPLLFESGENEICDVTVGIIADENLRKARITDRDGISEDKAKKRICAGKDSEFFKSNCDYIIENNGEEKAFEESAVILIEKILRGQTT